MVINDSVIPLYEQVSNSIQEKITLGELKPGDRIGSINEILKEYNVSRVTAVNALEDLVRKGFAVTRQGKGTFVKSGYIQEELMSLRSFREISVEGSSSILKFERITLSAESRKIFGRTDTDGVCIRRLQSYKDKPIALIDMVLPDSVAEKAVTDREILERSAMFDLLDNAGLQVVSAQQVISADSASSEVAGLLNLKEGSPILKVTRTSYTKSGLAVMYSTFYYRSDSYSFSVTLNRLPRK